MPTVIVRIEDLTHVPQLTTGAIAYISQSGTPYNATIDDFSKLINQNTGNFATTSNLQITGQTNYKLITGLSGQLTSPSINFTTNVDWSLGNIFYLNNLFGSKTITFSNTRDGQSITLATIATGSGIITWPTNVKWPSGIVPTPSTNKTDIYTFIQITTGIYANVIPYF